jgi:hypothetical protein
MSHALFLQCSRMASATISFGTKIALGAVASILALGWFLLRPICVPLPADFPTVGIENRTDRDFYLRVFQWHDGRWCQCKTYLSRQMFF